MENGVYWSVEFEFWVELDVALAETQCASHQSDTLRVACQSKRVPIHSLVRVWFSMFTDSTGGHYRVVELSSCQLAKFAFNSCQ